MTTDSATKAKTHILLIEDDPASLEILDFVLTSAGYEVVKAAGGEEALSLASSLPCASPCIILMDFQMPGLSGACLAERLRQQCKAELIAMSGNHLPDEALSAFDGFLLKPFGIPELKQQIEKTLTKVTKDRDNPAPQVLNEAIFSNLNEVMGSAALHEVYETCLHDADNRVEEMADAVAKGDEHAVRRLAHQLRGGCSMLGAEEVSVLAQDLEMGNSLGEWPIRIEDLRSALTRLRRILITKFCTE